MTLERFMTIVRCLRLLTPKRRIAVWVSLVCWMGWAAWIGLIQSQIPPAQWPIWAVFLGIGCGALAVAVFSVEFFRVTLKRLSTWTDRTQFAWVTVVFAVLISLQYVGVRMAQSAHG